MLLSTVRTAQPGDEQRAHDIVQEARNVMDRFRDHREAQRDGYRIFLPNVPQKMYHFTNYSYGFEAAFRFNMDHPTSLLYERTGDTYRLIGVMYTAPAKASEDELNERIPLSVGQWHKHVNLCMPPVDRRGEMFQPRPRFGLAGSIATAEECERAGGTFKPEIFGWMVHVYPDEPSPAAIWSVDRPQQGHTH
jgi:hypothetical protein